MNYLSACAIIKNESSYISEWIAFHILQGVEHFFIYENGSTDDTIAKLTSFPGFVTIIPWEKSPGQLSAYEHAIEKFKHSTVWMAFLDADEFLYSPHRPLPDILEEYGDVGAVAAHWYLFGSNEHEVKTDKLVIERFTRRQNDVNPHVKSIVKMAHAVKPIGPHAFHLTRRAVNESGVYMLDDYSQEKDGTAELLRVNHYHTKSLEEAKERWALPRADNGGHRLINFECHFNSHDRNEVEDVSAAVWAPKVREMIG